MALQHAYVTVMPQGDEQAQLVSDFLDFIQDAAREYDHFDWSSLVSQHSSPLPAFKVMIDGHDYQAHIIEVVSTKGKTANTAVCYAYLLGQSEVFFTLERVRDDWLPNGWVLPTTWECFKHLSKTEQYAALGI